MKYTNRMLALTLTLTMLPLLATAQLTSSQKLVTQVPFEFVLGSKIVPAGEWTVQLASMGSKTLVIGNSKAEVAMFSNTAPVEARKPAAHCALVFHKYGNSYFLSAVKIQGMQKSYGLPETKAEAEIRAQNVPATEETLLASLK